MQGRARRVRGDEEIGCRGVYGSWVKGQVGFWVFGFRGEIRTGNGDHKQIVAAENKDRREVYKAIAAKAGTRIEVVGKRRAIQIAEKAGPGEWLQRADGQWYQKR